MGNSEKRVVYEKFKLFEFLKTVIKVFSSRFLESRKENSLFLFLKDCLNQFQD